MLDFLIFKLLVLLYEALEIAHKRCLLVVLDNILVVVKVVNLFGGSGWFFGGT